MSSAGLDMFQGLDPVLCHESISLGITMIVCDGLIIRPHILCLRPFLAHKTYLREIHAGPCGADRSSCATGIGRTDSLQIQIPLVDVHEAHVKTNAVQKCSSQTRFIVRRSSKELPDQQVHPLPLCRGRNGDEIHRAVSRLSVVRG